MAPQGDIVEAVDRAYEDYSRNASTADLDLAKELYTESRLLEAQFFVDRAPNAETDLSLLRFRVLVALERSDFSLARSYLLRLQDLEAPEYLRDTFIAAWFLVAGMPRSAIDTIRPHLAEWQREPCLAPIAYDAAIQAEDAGFLLEIALTTGSEPNVSSHQKLVVKRLLHREIHRLLSSRLCLLQEP